MNLLQQISMLRTISEEAIEIRPAEDVWAENKDSAKTYISGTTYFVKKIDGGQKYEVTVEDGTTRKSFATLSKLELDNSFTPIRPNQTPDAEGYIQYRDVDEVEAFKYTGDPIKIEGVGQSNVTLINKGDYLTKKAAGNNFEYEVKRSKDFETNYSPK